MPFTIFKRHHIADVFCPSRCIFPLGECEFRTAGNVSFIRNCQEIYGNVTRLFLERNFSLCMAIYLPSQVFTLLVLKARFSYHPPSGISMQLQGKEWRGFTISRTYSTMAGLESFCCFQRFLTISRIIYSSCYWPGFFNWAGACNLTAWLQCTAKALHWYVLHCRVALLNHAGNAHTPHQSNLDKHFRK